MNQPVPRGTAYLQQSRDKPSAFSPQFVRQKSFGSSSQPSNWAALLVSKGARSSRSPRFHMSPRRARGLRRADVRWSPRELGQGGLTARSNRELSLSTSRKSDVQLTLGLVPMQFHWRWRWRSQWSCPNVPLPARGGFCGGSGEVRQLSISLSAGRSYESGPVLLPG